MANRHLSSFHQMTASITLP